jgi:hypothetical protein
MEISEYTKQLDFGLLSESKPILSRDFWGQSFGAHCFKTVSGEEFAMTVRYEIPIRQPGVRRGAACAGG